jgi:hypothetical protein
MMKKITGDIQLWVITMSVTQIMGVVSPRIPAEILQEIPNPVVPCVL